MPASTRAELGAWLLRCNPLNNPALIEHAEAGGRVGEWCVVGNYRSAMMITGDPVLLWVSGNGRLLARGICGGTGVVTSPPRRAEGADGLTVAVDIPLLTAGIADRELRASGIDDLEVQTQPVGSNPSWVSRTQYARLEPLLRRR